MKKLVDVSAIAVGFLVEKNASQQLYYRDPYAVSDLHT